MPRSGSRCSGCQRVKSCRRIPSASRIAAPRSAKKFVEFVVGTDPDPLDGITPAIADRANVERHSNRPNIRKTMEFFKLQRVMPGVFREQAKGAACGFSLRRVEVVIRPPKCRRRSRDHNRSTSSGSLPSALAFSTKASSFGRGRGSFIICSQCWSPCASSHSLSNTARRSWSVSFGSSLMISDALTARA